MTGVGTQTPDTTVSVVCQTSVSDDEKRSHKGRPFAPLVSEPVGPTPISPTMDRHTSSDRGASVEPFESKEERPESLDKDGKKLVDTGERRPRP